MNIHPIFVHFPIALLTVYSCFELAGYFFKSLRAKPWFFAVNATLLFTGAVSAIAALVTGGIAEDLVENGLPYSYILEVHEPFAAATTLVYLVLAAAYLNRVFDRNEWMVGLTSRSRLLAWGWNVKKAIARVVLDTWLLPVLALLGLVLMTITGALGAAVVYGPNVDPFVTFIYHWFW